MTHYFHYPSSTEKSHCLTTVDTLHYKLANAKWEQKIFGANNIPLKSFILIS